ncbi:6-phosphogluconate dehydrogenase, decarboxylating [Candidatus Portiera aleyrodidarum]|uniref:6-phosphogluconate dehydrogenase, decarboxylating n=1 Tax=Candidatus Portiera aleyrodidarum TV TaxID=1297582 RepID=A0A8D3XB15_9GAMM|nr:decarboxylating 6-phosphogluconate dehydrogenase [Candidatus Portiera aleyrodidarum]AGI27159.1 6-phosphogluconate dehydrogenase, decarboxylating [Candidatus Portiera aleyrodidarum TV]CEI59136.1 6-phosphogluconate dehydrogenase, decarboxylating [Candidatus Portiera aleyrodidarum]
MIIGIIGLGKMGGNISIRLLKNKYTCYVFDKNITNIKQIEKKGGIGVKSLKDLVLSLSNPRTIWLMLPAGEITEKIILKIINYMEKGDTIIDGSNGYFKKDIQRSEKLVIRGINYIDVGVSGGIWGLKRGFCMMIGGNKKMFEKKHKIFCILSSEKNKCYMYCGKIGSGHFVKMIHNGIEYGMMQSYAEGFDIMNNINKKHVLYKHRYQLNLYYISEIWRRGSVIESWLLDLISISLAKDVNLKEFSGKVKDSGEVRWIVKTALEESIPVEVLTTSLYVRFKSRMNNRYGEKLLSAMRKQFGGHVEEK